MVELVWASLVRGGIGKNAVRIARNCALEMEPQRGPQLAEFAEAQVNDLAEFLAELRVGA